VDILISPDQLDTKGLPLHEVVILHLIDDFSIRKASNEHGFFVVVTFLNKIGEGGIRDLTGDIPFHVTFKCHVQRPNKGEILMKAMMQFLIYIKLNSISLQLSGPLCISNCRPTPGVIILNTRFGYLNMIVKMMLQNIHWFPLGISAFCSDMLFLLISKAWT